MLEGMIEGISGAIAASLIIYFARNQVLGLLDSSSWAGPRHCGHPRRGARTGVLLMLVGAMVGAVGSAVAVRRLLGCLISEAVKRLQAAPARSDV